MSRRLLFNLLLLVFLSLVSPKVVLAGYDCPGRSTPPSSGVYTRYCTDGNNDGNDQGRLIKPWLYPGERVYPGDTLKIHARVLDYNETCGDGCLKNLMENTDIRQLAAGNSVGLTKLRITLFNPSGTQVQTWDQNTTSNSSTGGGSYPTTDNETYAFSGTTYGTWWIRYEDIETDNSRVGIGDYTWQPIDYQADLDTTPTSFYGYTVPMWIKDYYEASLTYLQSLQIQDGPSKGLFHNSIVEPRMYALGGSTGPVVMYNAYEDTMQSGFTVKSLYDLWLITRDTRIATMLDYIIDNTYSQYQGDFNPSTNDGDLDPGTPGNWKQGNYNDNCAVYAYVKPFNQEPYANQQFWSKGKTTWNASGWAVKTANGHNDCGGDQFLGQAVGVYYAIKYLEQNHPTSPNINLLKNAIKAGNNLTGGTSQGWTWISNLLGGRAQGVFYSILQAVDPSIGDYMGGNNENIEQWYKNSSGAGYGLNALDRIQQAGNAETTIIRLEDDTGALMYNAVAQEIYDKTTSDFGGDMTMSDYRSALNQLETNANRFFTANGHVAEPLPYLWMYWRGGSNDFFLNETTANASILHSYACTRPLTEAFYPHEIFNNSNATNTNYSLLYNVVKQSEFDETYNYLPMDHMTKDGIGLAVYYDEICGYHNYVMRWTTSTLEQLALYLNLHKTNANKVDLDTDNISVDLLNKQWDVNNVLSFRPWVDGSVKISNANALPGSIYHVTKESGGTSSQTINTSGETNLDVATNEKYSIDNDTYKLAVVPGTGDVSVSVSNWSNASKDWTETSVTHNNTTTNTVSGLNPLTAYSINVDGNQYTLATSNSSGVITFDYSGGFSTKTFSVTPQVNFQPSGAPSCQDSRPASVPNLFQINPQTESVDLFFTPVLTSADRYFVSYSTSPTAEQFGFEFVNKSNGIISVPVKALQSNTKYYFKVRAGNGCQPGGWSSIVGVKTNIRTFSNIFPNKTPFQTTTPLVKPTETPSSAVTTKKVTAVKNSSPSLLLKIVTFIRSLFK